MLTTVCSSQREGERLDLLHYIIKYALEHDNILVPLRDRPKRILECGFGTGVWAREVAQEYPDCAVSPSPNTRRVSYHSMG